MGFGTEKKSLHDYAEEPALGPIVSPPWTALIRCSLSGSSRLPFSRMSVHPLCSVEPRCASISSLIARRLLRA